MPKLNSTVPGLSIREKSYSLRRMVAGVHIQKALGKTEDISLEEAEHIAVELINAVKKDGALALEAFARRKRAGVPNLGSNQLQTIADVAQELIHTGKTQGTRKTKSKKWKRDTVRGWEDWIKSQRMAELINRPLASVTPQDIVEWYITDLRNGHPTATDNAFRKLRRVVNWAIGDDLITDDITKRMAENQRRVSVPKRDSRLDINKGEPGRFALALTEYVPPHQKATGETIKHILLMSLLTGRRTRELKQMEWSWVDLENHQINVPGEVILEDDLPQFEGTKSRRDSLLPMSRLVRTMMHERWETAQELVKAARKKKDNELARAASRYVFLGKDSRKPIADFRTTKQRVLDKAGLQKKMMHDLRRTFGAVLGALDKDFYSAQLAMDHSVNQVTADYMGSLSLAKKTEMFQEVEDWFSTSMPLNIRVNDQQYYHSGIEEFDVYGKRRHDNGFNKYALEYLAFPDRVWRDGWVKHNGVEDIVDIAAIAEAQQNETMTDGLDHHNP